MPEREGLWSGRIQLRFPAYAGAPILQGEAAGDVSILGTIREGADDIVTFQTRTLTNSAVVRFFVSAPTDAADNFYRIHSPPAVRVGDLPLGDLFDRDIIFNPPESRPNNNDVARAVQLGSRSDAWAPFLSWVLDAAPAQWRGTP